MTTVAKIIVIITVVKGLVMLIVPSYVRKAVEYFGGMENNRKRLIGLFEIILGLLLVYFSRAEISMPLVHWIVAVTGIFMVLYGLIFTVVPGLIFIVRIVPSRLTNQV